MMVDHDNILGVRPKVCLSKLIVFHVFIHVVALY